MRFLNWAFGIMLFLLLLAFATVKIDDLDTMQYLANGRFILSHGLNSNFCFYTYIPHNCQTAYANYSHEWFFHVITYVVYLIGQWNVLELFQIAIILAIFSALALASKVFRYSIFSTGIFIFLAILIGMERFFLRADLFGILTAVSFYLVFRYYIEGKLYEKKGKQKFLPLIIIFLVQMLWANTHGSFPLAFVIIFAYIFSYVFQFLLDKYLFYKKGVTFLTSHFFALLSILCISVVASLLNPFGISAFFDAFNPTPAISQTIHEWQSPFAPIDFQYFSRGVYEVLFFTVIVILPLSYKKLRLADIFILLALGYLSASYVRDIVLFAVFCAVILPKYLDWLLELIDHLFRKNQKILRSISIGKQIGMIIIVVFSISTIYSLTTNEFYLHDQRTRTFGIGLSEYNFPISAASFIERNNITGNMFNDYDTGTYLNWRFYPSRKTFIDGYTFSPDSLDFYNRIMSGNVNYNDVANKYHINYFILNHIDTAAPGLIKRLYSDKKWVLVYFDEVSVIFVKNTPENKAVIDQFAINFPTGKNYDPDRLVTFTDPVDFPKGFITRGVFLTNIGLYQNANYEYQKAVAIGTDDYQAYSGLGATYAQLGSDELALEYFKKAVDLAPDYAPNHYNLAFFYFNKGMYDQALDEFNKALSINSATSGANYLIGYIYLKRGDIADAKDYFQRELDINPGLAVAQKALRTIQ